MMAPPDLALILMMGSCAALTAIPFVFEVLERAFALSPATCLRVAVVSGIVTDAAIVLWFTRGM